VWEDYSTKALMAVASPRGSAVWGPPHTTSTGTPDPQSQAAIAVDEQGNAVVAFTTLSTQPSVSFRARVAGFDAAPPSLSAVLISPSVSASFPAAFSAVASDVWSTPRVSWSFGDGGTADGASVSHVFGTPNASSATVTATDDVGHSTSQSGPVTVVLGDRDRDGVLSDRDCDDANAGVRPGSRDVPGNGVDENCDGADANWATLATTVRLDWVRTRRGLRVASLGVRGVRQGDTIVVRCRGGGCKRASYRLVLSRAPKHAAASLNAATRGATLRAGTALTVEVDRQDYSTRVTTWTVRSGKGPKQSVRCRIPGAKTTQVCA